MKLEHEDLLYEMYQMREKFVRDKFRPSYHFLPPEGNWNDLNGMQFKDGCYHVGYLQKIGNKGSRLPFSSWQHISSRDLIHWKYHRAYLDEPFEDTKGDYFNSGDAAEGVDIPTIIANMPRKGICIYQCHDENLDVWEPAVNNPVIPIDADLPECAVFDPFLWKEDDTYYMLMGNKNFRPGYEGDSTSLLKSKDLSNWEYLGPFYKSDRKWTDAGEDCACVDFYKFGNEYMLLMHSHSPYYKSQYYIGEYKDNQFYPQRNGQLSHLGSGLFGPETLIDDKGRRIFMATLFDSRNYEETGWHNVMTLPRHFYPDDNNNLKMKPVVELESLRYKEKRIPDFKLTSKQEIVIPEFSSDCMEMKFSIHINEAKEFGFKVFCSEDLEEETVVTYNVEEGVFTIDYFKASLNKALKYQGYTVIMPNVKNGERVKIDNTENEKLKKQKVPYDIKENEVLNINVFIDKSIIEIFVNDDICISQRVYPTKDDSKGVRFFSSLGEINIEDAHKWEMDATNLW